MRPCTELSLIQGHIHCKAFGSSLTTMKNTEMTWNPSTAVLLPRTQLWYFGSELGSNWKSVFSFDDVTLRPSDVAVATRANLLQSTGSLARVYRWAGFEIGGQGSPGIRWTPPALGIGCALALLSDPESPQPAPPSCRGRGHNPRRSGHEPARSQSAH